MRSPAKQNKNKVVEFYRKKYHYFLSVKHYIMDNSKNSERKNSQNTLQKSALCKDRPFQK